MKIRKVAPTLALALACTLARAAPEPADTERTLKAATQEMLDATPEISVTARCDGDKLVFERDGRPDRVFLAELKDQFFEPGFPRTRRLFQRDAAGAITGFVDRREERDIRWARVP